jgi:hypothetical protein
LTTLFPASIRPQRRGFAIHLRSGVHPYQDSRSIYGLAALFMLNTITNDDAPAVMGWYNTMIETYRVGDPRWTPFSDIHSPRTTTSWLPKKVQVRPILRLSLKLGFTSPWWNSSRLAIKLANVDLTALLRICWIRFSNNGNCFSCCIYVECRIAVPLYDAGWRPR